ncbi:MAG TPA: class I SAM-dependent methyltransferase family protein [Pilimelia sp.]|nr:class I SAM-dependent methyltransferase family protein [Pilimelia sp.]
MSRDWADWHDAYDDPGSCLARRLAAVREHVATALAAAPPGPVRVVSMCAGQGRDLLGVLPGHPRRADVTARLVELDPANVAAARAAATAAGLTGVAVVEGDAALTDAYAGAVPADLVLVCGVFGNVSDADVHRIIDALPAFAAPGATVVWTRHREEPDLVPAINDWFAAAGFELAWLSARDAGYGVGVHRFAGEHLPLPPGAVLFTFVGEPQPEP